nr:ABC transporter B family member 19-like [Physcomitrium patens]|eukprot:XP_024359181.1 ABC transporter B family member 19-like [Physcomitrella patens]
MGGGRDEQPAPHSERAQCGGWSRAKVQTAEGGRFLAITRPNVQMKQKVQTISVIQLFAFADAIDCLLLFIGTVGAVIHGRAATSDCVNDHEMPERNVPLLYRPRGLHRILGSAEVAAWMQTAERQAARIRVRYLQAILKQDVSFFDTDVHTGEIVSSISSDTLHIQDAIGEKMGNFVQYACTFISGFAVAFSATWKLSLVTLGVLPPIALIGVAYAASLTGITSKISKRMQRRGE